MNTDSTLQNELLNTKQELEQLRKQYVKGIFIRARARWIEEGEKPSKYFLSLEKRNYINKTVFKLIDSQGNTLTEQENILKEIKSFYVNLYTSKDEQLEDITLENIIDKDVVNVLNDDSANKLEGKITYQEALLALKHMKNDKSPGPDGFTVEFYKFFGET